ncbi:hypothetical protein BXY64_3179 [Marinifilum flexuosum]|uniref:Uncharacterized protein n=1 Tax=Marinifilum flexuosum TaxID=1117708 RepID=A0A419WXJ7_9BACT|nr:hypothetical protein BXY64_3179 [Marinifilum flexuosum]
MKNLKDFQLTVNEQQSVKGGKAGSELADSVQ